MLKHYYDKCCADEGISGHEPFRFCCIAFPVDKIGKFRADQEYQYSDPQKTLRNHPWKGNIV